MIRQDIRRGRILLRAVNLLKSSRSVPRACFWLALGLVLMALLFAGCKSTGKAEQPVVMGDVPSGGSTSARWQPVAADFVMPKDAAPAPRVDGKRAMQYVRETVAFGSRPIGSPAHRQVEDYIHQKLAAWHVAAVDDAFTAQTAAGVYPMRNIIAKIPGNKDGIIVVAGHYDTNLPLPKTYVGANDGGSSTGLLLEMADVLRGKQLQGYSVWLVWLDGEEATVHWTDTDSLYGSRHLAQLWQQDGTAKKIKAFLLLDMVGDADLNIDRDTQLDRLAGRPGERCGSPAGIPVALLRPATRGRRRSPAVRENRCPGGRPHRLRLRIRQRLLAHPAGHGRQTQPQQPANRRRHGLGDDPGARRALKHFRLKIFDFRFNGLLRDGGPYLRLP